FSTALSIGVKIVSPLYYADMSFPAEEVQAAVTPKTKLIVIVSPNNPTGTSASVEQIEAIVRKNSHIPVYVDEAYYEFSGKTAVPLLAKYDNLVISRTFSKAMAMAGLRFGYAVGRADFLGQLEKLRIPYDVNALALVAAQASLDNPQPWQSYVREVVEQSKPMTERFLREHGVQFYPSDANFLLVRCKDVAGAVKFLETRDILVRPQRPPVGDCFRVSMGTVDEMRRFMQAYSEYLQQAGAAA
ncbi:MAG TPA: histidinol-phosphate transaminase, partial [bacterium]